MIYLQIVTVLVGLVFLFLIFKEEDTNKSYEYISLPPAAEYVYYIPEDNEIMILRANEAVEYLKAYKKINKEIEFLGKL